MGGNVDDFIFVIGLRGGYTVPLVSYRHFSSALCSRFVSAYLNSRPTRTNRGRCWTAEAETTDGLTWSGWKETWPA